MTRPSTRCAIISSSVSRTSWMRGSLLAAVFMPCLQNPAALRSDDSANRVQFVGAEAVTSGQLDRFEPELAGALLSRSTCTCVGSLQSKLVKKNRYGPGMLLIKLAREHNARNRCLSPEEEARLLDAVPAWMRPLITVALHTGMRLGELRALQREDVDEKTGSIRIRRDKAGDGRWVAMNSVVREALHTIKRERKVLAPFVFCSPEGKYLHNFERHWRSALTAARIPNFRFHDLRHTFASRLAMTPGVDLYTVQRAGGWKTPIMVQRYAHLSPDHIRAAVEKLAQGTSSAATGTAKAQRARHARSSA